MIKMQNCLLLHIGMPKTGSTAITNFLNLNREKLEEYGWSYPDLYHEMKNVSVIDEYTRKRANGRNMLLYNNNPQKELQSPEWLEGIEIVAEKLKKQNVILSYPGLMIRTNLKNIIEEYQKYFDNIKVICYLRRQDLYMEAYWNQHIKGCLSYEHISEKMDSFIEKWNIEKLVDYYGKIRDIADSIGKENIYVRVFEKGQFQGRRKDVISDFLSVLNLPEEAFECDLTIDKKNERICNNYLEIKQLVNGQWGDATKGLYYIESKLKEYTKEKNFEKDYYMPTKQRQEILEQFARGNEKIAREYLDREDGRLFYDEKIDFPCYQSPFEEKDEDIIKLFASVMSRQDLLIEQLQNNMEYQSKKIQGMQEKLIKNLCGERKIVFFGAGFRGFEAIEKINLPIAFVLDNCKDKQGQKVCGLEIKHPESIENWDELFIIITVDKYLDIKEQLENIGLKEDKNFILYSELI